MLRRWRPLLLAALALCLCSFWGHTPPPEPDEHPTTDLPPATAPARRVTLPGGRFLIYEGDRVSLVETDGTRVPLGSLKDADDVKTTARPTAAAESLRPPLLEKREARVVVTKRGPVYVPPQYLITFVGDDHVVAVDAVNRAVRAYYVDGSVIKE